LPWAPLRLAATGPAAQGRGRTRAMDHGRACHRHCRRSRPARTGPASLAPPPIALSDSDDPAGRQRRHPVPPSGQGSAHDATRLSQADAQALADRLTRLVAAITDAGPDADLTTLSALTNEETARLSGAFAATARDYDRR
jgi:hypothetical protein